MLLCFFIRKAERTNAAQRFFTPYRVQVTESSDVRGNRNKLRQCITSSSHAFPVTKNNKSWLSFDFSLILCEPSKEQAAWHRVNLRKFYGISAIPVVVRKIAIS